MSDTGIVRAYTALGDHDEAQRFGRILTERMHKCPERTWRALAALADIEAHPQYPAVRPAEADRLLVHSDVPLVAWKVFASAALIVRASHQIERSERILEQANACSQRLMQSLESDDPLRATLRRTVATALDVAKRGEADRILYRNTTSA
jgi:hypothetical protein